MAERRMFSKTIIDSDAFVEMPLSTQALYFHLSMRADDDGFVNKPRRIREDIGASEDDMKLLIAKRFVIAFESGVIVIKHWRIHNYIQKDRYKPTAYVKEKSMLKLEENKVYTECIHFVSKMDTQVRLELELGKDRDSIDTTTTYNSNSSITCAHAREEKEWGEADKGLPPTLTQVAVYMKNEHDVKEAASEAEKFCAWNAKVSWDCLPNWQRAADLWCSRIMDHGKD